VTRPLSVVIITKNEQRNIERCLTSVKWADEVVIVDSGSTDKTVDICQKHDCRVFEIDWLGFSGTKQYAVDQATNDWILSIDADERVTANLRSEIESLLDDKPQYHGYQIPRQSTYLGQIIRHSGWNRDRPLRLFNREFGAFNAKSVHEAVHVQGHVGELRSFLLHHPYPDIQTHLEKMNLYTELAAQELAAAGRRSTPLGAVVHGATKFIKMYVLQRGFLDGTAGFVLAKNSAFGVYLKYIKLWQKTR